MGTVFLPVCGAVGVGVALVGSARRAAQRPGSKSRAKDGKFFAKFCGV